MDGVFRSGFVSLMGRPNVGKSTLLNRILKKKIAITSPKPQTTRNRIIGIHNMEGAQCVYIDTPGMHEPMKELNRMMVSEARKAAQSSDLCVMVIEAHRPWEDEDLVTLELVEKLEVKRVLAINKVDKTPREQVLPVIDHSSRLAVFSGIVPVSALKGWNLDRLTRVVADNLPQGGPSFPPEVTTDRAERFLVAEIIREKVVNLTREELPYSSAVVVSGFEEGEGLVRISARVLVERDSQKGIVIGRGGGMLKRIGSAARKDIERFLGQKVYLDLTVKAVKNWWQDPEAMREMGFGE